MCVVCLGLSCNQDAFWMRTPLFSYMWLYPNVHTYSNITLFAVLNWTYGSRTVLFGSTGKVRKGLFVYVRKL